MNAYDFDVVIIGGGPAGLSAALLLARARREVLVCDEGAQRNRFSHALHGFITRDGCNPSQFIELAKQDLNKYATVTCQTCRVVNVTAIADGFRVAFEGECSEVTCKKILLATGVIDELPPLPGVDRYFGTSVFHCPYCDCYEYSDQAICAYGQGEHGRQLALELLGWSKQVTLVSNGSSGLDETQVDQLTRCGIQIVEEPVARLVGEDGKLTGIRFTNGREVPCKAMFFKTENYQKSLLADKLGCNFTPTGLYETLKFESTNIPGLFVAGDASHSLHMVSIATASGTEAAFAINTQLLREQIKYLLSTSADPALPPTP